MGKSPLRALPELILIWAKDLVSSRKILTNPQAFKPHVPFWPSPRQSASSECAAMGPVSSQNRSLDSIALRMEAHPVFDGAS